MFRRALVVAAVTTATATVALALPASAGGPNRTTITIACDRNVVHAEAEVTLYDHVGGTPIGDPTTVVCGTEAGLAKRDRAVIDAPGVGAAAVAAFEIAPDGESTLCADQGALTFGLVCDDATGSGAKITVR